MKRRKKMMQECNNFTNMPYKKGHFSRFLLKKTQKYFLSYSAIDISEPLIPHLNP